MVIMHSFQSAHATDIAITPSTSGGLAAAVDAAAPGDTVMLSAGRYTGPENRNISLTKQLTIQSAPGESAATVIIDAEYATRCLLVMASASGTVLRGITLANGNGRVALRESESATSHPHDRFDSSDQVSAEQSRDSTVRNFDGGFPRGNTNFTHESSDLDLAEVLSQLGRKQIVATLERWVELVGVDDAYEVLPKVLQVRVGNDVVSKASVHLNSDPAPPAPSQQTASSQPVWKSTDCAPAPDDVPGGCSGRTTLTETCGSLTEGSAGDYSSNADCVWVLDPPGAKSIYVSFTMLDVEPHSTCRYDAVHLEDDIRNLGKFCGTLNTVACAGAGCDSANLRALHVASPLTIRFESDISGQEAGFALSWRASSDPPPGPKLVSPELSRSGGCLLVESAEVTMDDVTLRGGVAEFGGGVAFWSATAIVRSSELRSNFARIGAGVFSNGTSLTIEESRFTENRAPQSATVCEQDIIIAGGAGLFFMSSKVSMSGSEVSWNAVESSSGCADSLPPFSITGGGVAAIFSDVELTTSYVRSNSLTLQQGKAVASGGGFFSTNGNLSVSSSQVTTNFVICDGVDCQSLGGGMYSVHGNVALSSSHVSNNSLRCDGLRCQSLGGGMYGKHGDVVLSSSHVTNNSLRCQSRCKLFGGGIFFEGGNNLTVASSHVTQNLLVCDAAKHNPKFSEVAGGGMSSTHGNVFISSSLITNNSLRCSQELCKSRGGGISFLGSNILSVASSHLNENSVICDREPKHPASVDTKAFGGGIFCLGALVYVSLSHVSQNVLLGEDAAGGGIYSVDGNASVFVSSSLVANNSVHSVGSSYGSFGGGLFLKGSDGSVSLSDVVHNSLSSAKNSHGGGIYSQRSGIVLVSSSRVTHNSAHSVTRNREVTSSCGGGIWASNSNLSVSSSNVSYNSLSSDRDSAGGGVYSNSGFLRVSSSHVSSNFLTGCHAYIFTECEVHGGGLWFELVDVALVSSSHVSSNVLISNRRARGGGLWQRESIVSVSFSFLAFNFLDAFEEAYGGAIFSSTGVLVSEFCSLENNTVKAPEKVRGGGICADGPRILSVTWSQVSGHRLAGGPATDSQGSGVWSSAQKTTLAFSNITFNLAHGLETSGGGCYFLGNYFGDFIGNYVFVDTVLLLQNSVRGNAVRDGGGLMAYNTEIHIDRCAVEGNFAGSGAALVLLGRTRANVQRTVVADNQAQAMGAGLQILGSVQLQLTHVQFKKNEALLFSDIVAIGVGIAILVSNCTFDSRAELQGLVQGDDLELFNHSTWSNQRPGVAFVLEQAMESRIIRFDRCPTESYILGASTSVNRLNCSACPTGAQCAGGTEVYALRSHWGWLNTSSQLTMARCPEGYCCPHVRCPPFNYCHANRAGFLCGTCRRGFSEVLGASGCKRDDDCQHLNWLVPSVVMLTGLFTLAVLHLRKRRAEAIHLQTEPTSQVDGGDLKVVVFFFQLLPLVMTAESQEAESGFLQVLLSVFNLSFTSGLAGSSDTGGWCPFPGFSALQKISSRFLIPGLCVAWLALLSVGQSPWVRNAWSLLGLKLTDGSQYKGFGGNLAALLSLLGLGYSTLVQATFQLVACVQVDGRLLLYRSAEVVCFQPWQQALLSTIAPILGLWPALLSCIVWRLRRRAARGTALGVAERAVLQSIARPYDGSRRISHQWEAVLMLQRLLLIVISVFVIDPLWRAWLLVGLMLPMMLVHMLLHPFRRYVCNVFMASCYLALLAIGAWEVGLAVYRSHGLTLPHGKATSFGGIISFLTLAPACFGCALRLWDIVGTKVVAWLDPRLPKWLTGFIREVPREGIDLLTVSPMVQPLCVVCKDPITVGEAPVDGDCDEACVACAKHELQGPVIATPWSCWVAESMGG